MLTPLGEIISSQSITSKSRTVETVTVKTHFRVGLIFHHRHLFWNPQYKKEHDGLVETRVEQKIIVQSDGDPVDHDRALEEAIQEATATNPDMTVEKIEIQQTPKAPPTAVQQSNSTKFVY